MENQNSAAAESNTSEEVKDFIAKGFFPLIKKVLLNPADLSNELSGKDTATKSIVMIVICGILYMLLPYLFIGRLRDWMGFRPFAQLGLLSVIVLLLITVFAYLLKLSKTKTVTFKDELLVGGLCAVPLIITLVIYCIMSLFGSDIFSSGIGAMYNGGWLLSLIGIYCLLLLINIFYQSLCSTGFKNNSAWYLSPLAILLAFYVAFKIAYSLF